MTYNLNSARIGLRRSLYRFGVNDVSQHPIRIETDAFLQDRENDAQELARDYDE